MGGTTIRLGEKARHDPNHRTIRSAPSHPRPVPRGAPRRCHRRRSRCAGGVPLARTHSRHVRRGRRDRPRTVGLSPRRLLHRRHADDDRDRARHARRGARGRLRHVGRGCTVRVAGLPGLVRDAERSRESPRSRHDVHLCACRRSHGNCGGGGQRQQGLRHDHAHRALCAALPRRSVSLGVGLQRYDARARHRLRRGGSVRRDPSPRAPRRGAGSRHSRDARRAVRGRRGRPERPATSSSR